MEKKADGTLTMAIVGGLFALMAAACAHQKTLMWQDTSDNENGFRIYRGAGREVYLIGEVGPGVTRFVDSHAPPGSCYIVTAYNAAGESAPTALVCGR